MPAAATLRPEPTIVRSMSDLRRSNLVVAAGTAVSRLTGLARIVAFGESVGLPVTAEEVKSHLATHDDLATKQWLVKARGGL